MLVEASKKDINLNALELFKEGASLMYNDNEKALEKFLAAKNVAQDFVPAYYNAGLMYEVLGKNEEAEKIYEACLLVKKDEGPCLENLLLIKAMLKKNQNAMETANQYLALYPQAPSIQVAVAKLEFVLANYEKAEEMAKKALEREPENVEALFVMMRIFYMQKRFSAAKWVCKTALEIAPSHGAFYLWQGHIQSELKEFIDALASYSQSVKFAESSEALESYGLLLLKRGKVKEALIALKKLSKLNPNDYRNYLHLGNAYLANKEFLEAKDSYERSLFLNQDNKDVIFNLGILYYDNEIPKLKNIERYKKAKEYFSVFIGKKNIDEGRKKEALNYIKSLENKIEKEEEIIKSMNEQPEEVLEEEQKIEEEAVEKKEEKKEDFDLEEDLD